MIPLDEAQAAALDAPHLVPAIDAQGYYLGMLPREQATARADFPPPPVGVWKWNGSKWVREPTLAEAKADRRQVMAQAWNQARQAGVSFGAKTAPSDTDSWVRYLAIKEMAADGGWLDVPIPLADGSFELMTQAKMVTLWGALKTMERTLLAQLRDRVEAINAATTAEQVAAITWA